MNNLTYGNPPVLEDCTDIGTVPSAVAPRKITNEGRFAGREELIGSVYGMEIPPLRRVWMVVAHFRQGVRDGSIPSPYSVRLPGLGILVYDLDEHGENWRVLK